LTIDQLEAASGVNAYPTFIYNGGIQFKAVCKIKKKKKSVC